MENSAFSDTDVFNCEIPYVPPYESEEAETPKEIPDMVSGPHVLDLEYYNPVVLYDAHVQSQEEETPQEIPDMVSGPHVLDLDYYNPVVLYDAHVQSQEEQTPQEIPDMVSGPHVLDMDYYNPVVSYDAHVQSDEEQTPQEIPDLMCDQPDLDVSYYNHEIAFQAVYESENDHAHLENSSQESMESEEEDQTFQESSEEDNMDSEESASNMEPHGGIPYRCIPDNTEQFASETRPHHGIPYDGGNGSSSHDASAGLDLSTQHKIFEAHSNGESYGNIAERYNITISKARYIFRKMENIHGPIPGNNLKKRLNTETIEEIRTHFMNGFSTEEIASLFDISSTTVRNYTINFEKYSQKLSKALPKINLSHINLQTMSEARKNGESYSKIAARYKITPDQARHHISKYRRDHGLP